MITLVAIILICTIHSTDVECSNVSEDSTDERSVQAISRRKPIADLISQGYALLQESEMMPGASAILMQSLTAIKVLGIGYTIFAAVSYFYPSVGEAVEHQTKSLVSGFSEVDLKGISNSLKGFQPLDRLMNFADLDPYPECRSKAVCEAAQFVVVNYPYVAKIITIVGVTYLPIEDKYSKSFTKGITKFNCAAAYRSCKYSPSKRFFNSSL